MNPNSKDEKVSDAAKGDDVTEMSEIPQNSVVTPLTLQEMGMLRTMLSVWTSFCRPISVETDADKDPRSINININKSSDLPEMSNISSVSGCSRAVVNQLTEIKGVLSEINHSLKALACSPFPMTPSKLQEQNSTLSVRSEEFPEDAKKSYLIRIDIPTPDGKKFRCFVLPPKFFIQFFGGTAAWQHEKKGLATDALKLLLFSAWKTFGNDHDRVIVPVVLEWETDNTKSVTDYGTVWKEEVDKWCPVGNRTGGQFSALAVVATSSGPFLFVFSYDYGLAATVESVEPMLTGYLSERKGIPAKFPWAALGDIFMDLLSVEDTNQGAVISALKTRTVANLDPFSEKTKLSELFPMKDEDFLISLPRDNWKTNDYSLAVFGVVRYCSTNVTGRMSVPRFNPFLGLEERLSAAMIVDVPAFRNAICWVLWDVFFKLVTTKVATLRSSVDGLDLPEEYDEESVFQGFRDEMESSFAPHEVVYAADNQKRKNPDTADTQKTKTKKLKKPVSTYSAHGNTQPLETSRKIAESSSESIQVSGHCLFIGMWYVNSSYMGTLPTSAKFDEARVWILEAQFKHVQVITAKESKIMCGDNEDAFCRGGRHAKYVTGKRGTFIQELKGLLAYSNYQMHQIELDPIEANANRHLQFPEMKNFFECDLLNMLMNKKIYMGDFDFYRIVEGVMHCSMNSQHACYTSGSASIYVPWNTDNAAAVTLCLNKLSKYFAIYPLSSNSMKHSILHEVSKKANDVQNYHHFQMFSPPSLKQIQYKIQGYDKNLTCPPAVVYMLNLLDNTFGLDKIDYVCLKVLGCHHPDFSNNVSVTGFGMTVGGFFFPNCEKQFYRKALATKMIGQFSTYDENLFDSKEDSGEDCGSNLNSKFDEEIFREESSSESEDELLRKKSRSNEFANFFESSIESEDDAGSQSSESHLSDMLADSDVDNSSSSEHGEIMNPPQHAFGGNNEAVDDDVAIMAVISNDDGM